MQAQTQPQLGQPGGQLGSQTNSLASQGGTGAQRGWQTESDVTMRRMILEKILLLFQKRRSRISVEWQQRLPDFVKRLEESLYKEAATKEEYADLSTLEQRLQALVKRSTTQRTNPNVAVRGMSSTASSMIPTPGLSSTINGSTMIPTPGTELGNCIGNTMPSGSVSSLQGHRMISTNNVSNMIPTPGISSNAFPGNETSISAAKVNPMQQQSYGNRMNRNLNGRLGQGPMSNLQQKNPMSFGYVNGQHMPNGNLNFPNSHMFMSPGHQQLQHNMSMHHYAHTGNFYNPMSNGVPSNGLRMQSQGFQVSKMIPVPGLPSQLPNVQPQHQSQQSESKVEKLPLVNCQQKTLSSMKTLPQQEILKTKLQSDNTDDEKAVTAASSVEEHTQSMQQDNVVNECHVTSGQVEALVEEQKNKQRDTSQWPNNMDQGLTQDQGSSLPPKQNNTCNSQDASIPTAQAGSSVDTRSSSIGTTDPQRAQQYMKQQKYLLLLRHASKCTALEGQCQSTPFCKSVKDLWTHITKCTARNCQHPRCQATMSLVRHHQNCRDTQCPVCVPVRQKLLMQRVQASQNHTAQTGGATARKIGSLSAESSLNKCTDPSASSAGGLDVEPPPAKRPKVEPVDTMDIVEQNTHNISTEQSMANTVKAEQHTEPAVNIKNESHKTSNHTSGVVKTESQVIRNKSGPKVEQNVTNLAPDDTSQPMVKSEVKVSQPVVKTEVKVSQQVVKTEAKLSQPMGKMDAKLGQPIVKTEAKLSQLVVKTETKQSQAVVKQELQHDTSSCSVHENVNNVKGNKPKIKGVSLTELFTPEQIREHITGLRQWIGQSKAKAEKNQAMEHKMSESSCQLCAVETLLFEPPPIYCTPCGTRIKRNALYWTTQIGETRHYFCAQCVNDPRTDTVDVDGVNCPKSRLEKRRNDEETEEPWVLCDKCEKWQHQICALFNMRRNEGGQAEYTCPHCSIVEIEKGERKPLPQSAVLGAKDLPRTLLSDHIEQRLARKLKQERYERARAQGKSYDEVPGAESLVVRIVSSVDKRLEVKQRFWEMFQEEDYPKEFPYKSKVLLLFQKIEGVEVCLFGMYVQEFGAEASQPNQRRVYLSYLDSVKYFRPDVKTVHGEALRTFVYHEILIGYLDYCKRRGFTSCYIWACPPLKGEDYILYCHPEIQKTPKSDKLREWYLTMLRKAGNESIVAELTNMYDHFFVCTGESKAKVTAARLPYFDGDYWPGAAEDMIMQLEEEEIGRRQQKKGKTKKTVTKRVAKAGTQPELASNASKDLQLMHKLGETIYPMKEDFIMVHLQFACTHCCNFIISGHRWNCRLCKHFHLCDRCYDAEQRLDDREKHPVSSKETHPLYPVKLDEEFPDTKDKDEIMESEFFDTRQAFLSLCQGNHYQYDTLRRAKHSSMMVLYHLHNPTAPAFVTTCNLCQHDIETGQGWRCETCPDFDLCNTCYSKDDTPNHPHKLTPHPTAGDRDTQSNEARQQRVIQLRKMLDLLIHASQCGVAQCLYPNCRRVKALFRHGMSCKIRVSGGCPLCKKMWYILQIHARACKESECRVPRCKDLKEHTRRLQQQMESRRRAAVKEMMRQRTAEADGGAT